MCTNAAAVLFAHLLLRVALPHRARGIHLRLDMMRQCSRWATVCFSRCSPAFRRTVPRTPGPWPPAMALWCSSSALTKASRSSSPRRSSSKASHAWRALRCTRASERPSRSCPASSSQAANTSFTSASAQRSLSNISLSTASSNACGPRASSEQILSRLRAASSCAARRRSPRVTAAVDGSPSSPAAGCCHGDSRGPSRWR
mmetsp:Transcript_27296/g.77836  ORF Transcript_27296/g.77836 Transcript_27296/m.77836 type:complete len:201 (+) Transcript_27296:866-1468(+)